MTTPAQGTPNRRALLIGIDAYRAPERALTGCVNDVQLMRDTLVQHFQFPAENVTLVTDDAATRLGILQALEALLQTTGHDDNVVIHYAGHGSQMTDREGDEPSGLDSTWHTVDSNAWDQAANQWVGANRDITDDEIAIWIDRFAERTQYLTIVVDACHSGSISRDASELRARGSTPDTRPTSELPPSPIGALPKRASQSASGWGAPAQSFVLISGCRDEERSMEVNPSPDAGRNKPHGALTWFLTKNLKESENGTTYRDVFEMATAQVTREIPGQHPQMEGRVDRAIFGISDLPAHAYRLVTARNDRGEVTLRGGAAHGITSGSRYVVYAPGTRQSSGSTATPLGEIVVTTVRATTSIAQIVDKSEKLPNAIGEMCRAVEVQHAFDASRMDVLCVGALEFAQQVATLRDTLAKSVDVGVAGEGQPFVYRAELRDNEWTVTDAIGARISPTIAVGGEMLVASNIETVARWQRLLSLNNGDSSSPMNAKPPLSIEFLRSANGAWTLVASDADQVATYRVGEKIGFRISKDFEKDLFLTLFDLDPSGSIVRVWPNTTVSALRGSTPFDIVPGPMDGDWTMSWPDSEPMQSRLHSDADGEYVEENWILIATMQPADFASYEQSGTRGNAAENVSMRSIKMGPPKLDDDWAVVRKSLRIRRANG